MPQLLLKRRGPRALPFPNNPRFDTRRPRRVTALGRDTPGAAIAAMPDRQVVGKRLPCRTHPSSLKHGERIAGQKRNQAGSAIVILVVKYITVPFKIIAACLEVSWMATAFLEALNGRDSATQESCVELEKPLHTWEKWGQQDPAGFAPRSSFLAKIL